MNTKCPGCRAGSPSVVRNGRFYRADDARYWVQSGSAWQERGRWSLPDTDGHCPGLQRIHHQ